MTGQAASSGSSQSRKPKYQSRKPEYEFDPRNEDEVTNALERIKQVQRQGKKVLLLAGLAEYGKTELALSLCDSARHRQRPTKWTKTVAKDCHIYRIAGTDLRLCDMAGEHYKKLEQWRDDGDQATNTEQKQDANPDMAYCLWMGLQVFDGLILLIDLTRAPNEKCGAGEAAVLNHRWLLQYAIVARNRKRLNKKRRGDLNSDEFDIKEKTAPDKVKVEDAVAKLSGHRRMYDRPVSLVFSRADLYSKHKDNLPDPMECDPLKVAKDRFGDFQEWLEKNVRYFKWSFCQAKDESPNPTLIGGKGILDFQENHPWPWPTRGMTTAQAIKKYEKKNKKDEKKNRGKAGK